MSCAARAREPRYMLNGTTTGRKAKRTRSPNTAPPAAVPTASRLRGELQMGLGKRLSRLEHGGNRDEVEDDVHKQKRERANALHMAECSNRDSRREGVEPFFEITESGEVFSAYDGRLVVTGHQALCERLYWRCLAWGVRGLIHTRTHRSFVYRMGSWPCLERTYIYAD